MSRLEEIKSKWKERDINVLSHMDWLINRVEELEKENKLYKQALEFYADEYNWHEENVGGSYLPYYESDASRDGGEKARKALKGESDD